MNINHFKRQKSVVILLKYDKISSMVQNTFDNSDYITSTLYNQLYQIKNDRYKPYQPYIYPTIPQSVIDLQRSTINVGVPYSFFTCSDSKGVQSVTT